MSLTELKEVLNLLQGLVVPLLVYAMYLLSDIRDQLVKLNSRVTTLETWTREHEKLDTERTENIRDQIRDCPAKLSGHQGNHI